MDKPIAVCKNLLRRIRTTDPEVTELDNILSNLRLAWEEIDCYNYNIIDKLDNYSALLWHYDNYVNADIMEAQNILDIASAKGLKVYPDHCTAWHFDDKIAESYALDAVHAPIPRYWVFYELDKCLAWLKNKAQYPIVAKLRRGSGANNVKLIHSYREGARYARHMFSRGYSPAQSLLYKSYSKLQSSHNLQTIISRVRRIPDFVRARRFGKGMPDERGYCYFQEFTANDGFDLKIAVVNGKLGFLNRRVRKGDFRASGGGEIAYDKELLSDNIISSAFKTAEALKMQCVGFDYIVDSRTGQGKIIEMCHGFDHAAIRGCGGYYDKNKCWHAEPLDIWTEILKTMGIITNN
ncbi:MAG: hypothetical protein IJU23_09905 [Proteobacteria bacterium]|nr:hypothetical protein [Pseudomonadota bacterium]